MPRAFKIWPLWQKFAKYGRTVPSQMCFLIANKITMMVFDKAPIVTVGNSQELVSLKFNNKQRSGWDWPNFVRKNKWISRWYFCSSWKMLFAYKSLPLSLSFSLSLSISFTTFHAWMTSYVCSTDTAICCQRQDVDSVCYCCCCWWLLLWKEKYYCYSIFRASATPVTYSILKISS